MSHFISVRTAIKDRQALHSTLIEMMRQPSNRALSLQLNQAIADWEGISRHCDFAIIKAGKGASFGFKLNNDGVFDLISDSMYSHPQDFLEQLFPKYAFNLTVQALKDEGFNISSTETSDQYVTISAGKWV